MGLGGRDWDGQAKGQQDGSEETSLAGADTTRQGRTRLHKGKGEGAGPQMPG